MKKKVFFLLYVFLQKAVCPLRGLDTGVQYVQWNRTGALTLCKDHMQLVFFMFRLSPFLITLAKVTMTISFTHQGNHQTFMMSNTVFH